MRGRRALPSAMLTRPARSVYVFGSLGRAPLEPAIVQGTMANEVILRVAADPRRAEAWSFVLEAVGIAHRLQPSLEGVALVVDAAMASRAAAALADQEAEAVEER